MPKRKGKKEEKRKYSSADIEEKQEYEKESSAKKGKVYQQQKITSKDIDVSNRRLDALARLLERSDKNCAAVCFIEGQILITSNSIHQGTDLTENAGEEVSLIRSVMNYYSLVANGKTNAAIRENTFKQICQDRVNQMGAGFIKLDSEIIDKIALDVLHNYRRWESRPVKDIIEGYNVNQQPYILHSYSVINQLARDFLKLEQYIKEHSKEENNELIKAFKGPEKSRVIIDGAGGIWEQTEGRVTYDDQKNPNGYVIVNIDEQGVHAETKIIEYLIFTRILQSYDARKGSIYVGISKLCCRGCNNFVSTANKAFGNKVEIVEVRGRHGLIPEWHTPLILSLKDREPEQVAGYYYKEGKKKEELIITPIKTLEELKTLKGKNEVFPYVYLDNKLTYNLEAAFQKQKDVKVSKEDETSYVYQYHYSSSEPTTPEERLQQQLIQEHELDLLYKLRERAKQGKINVDIASVLSEILEILKTHSSEKPKEKPKFLIDKHVKDNAWNKYKDLEYLYQTQDINYIGFYTLQNLGLPNDCFTGALDNKGNSLEILQQKKESLDKGDIPQILGIYNTGSNHWIAFKIITNPKEGYKVFYKDSRAAYREDFEKDMQSIFRDTFFITHNDKEQTESPILYHCGIFALANLPILALLSDKEVENFGSVSFFNPALVGKSYNEAIRDKRTEFAAKFVNYLYTIVIPEELKAQKFRKQLKAIHDREAQNLSTLLQLFSPLDVPDIAAEIETKSDAALRKDATYNYLYRLECNTAELDKIKGALKKLLKENANLEEISNPNTKKTIIKIDPISLNDSKESQEIRKEIERSKKRKPEYKEKIDQEAVKSMLLEQLELDKVKVSEDLKKQCLPEVRECISQYEIAMKVETQLDYSGIEERIITKFKEIEKNFCKGDIPVKISLEGLNLKEVQSYSSTHLKNSNTNFLKDSNEFSITLNPEDIEMLRKKSLESKKASEQRLQK